MTRRPLLPVRFSALLGPDLTGARQSLLALTLGLVASLIAGLTLGSISDTLEELPGLLVLVPAAIGMRGTIFGALGSRLGTAVHAGTLRFSWRTDTVLGQNVLAAGVLTLSTSVGLAFLAKAVSVGFGLANTISVVDFLVISLVGGILASVVVLAVTVTLVAATTRFGWDPDNVMAPLVTAIGDLVTLPLLYVATLLVGIGVVDDVIAVVGVVGGVAAVVLALRSELTALRQIVRESLPVVLVAGTLSLVAGLTLEGRLDDFAEFPALLALVPPFLASAGSLGGILSNHLTSKLHLGVMSPSGLPGREARADILRVYGLSIPTFALASLVADLAAVVVDLPSPGPVDLVLIALIGGLLSTTAAIVVAYSSAVASFRVGLDPDNVAMPMVTSAIDLVGSLSFVIAVALVGVSG
ncbi:MAG: magnesium transporter [Actinomycetota bacterium]